MIKLRCPKCGCTEINENRGYVYDEYPDGTRVPIAYDIDPQCANCGEPVDDSWEEVEVEQK